MATNIFNPVTSLSAFGGLVDAQDGISLLNKWRIREVTLRNLYESGNKLFKRNQSKAYRINNIVILCLDIILASSDIGGSSKLIFSIAAPPIQEIVHCVSENKMDSFVSIDTGGMIRLTQRNSRAISAVIPYVIDMGEVYIE